MSSSEKTRRMRSSDARPSATQPENHPAPDASELASSAASDAKSLSRFRFAVAISAISQFFPYTVVKGSAYLGSGSNPNYFSEFHTSVQISTMGGTQTGIEAKSLWAIVPLCVLAYYYFTQARYRPFFSRHGHWVALALLLWCDYGQLATTGAKIGLIASALAAWGAYLRSQELGAAVPH